MNRLSVRAVILEWRLACRCHRRSLLLHAPFPRITLDRPDHPAHRRAQPAWQAAGPAAPACARRGSAGPACTRAARSAHLGDRSLQLPLRVLHAQGSVRQGLPLSAPWFAAQLRGNCPAVHGVCAARHGKVAPDWWRAAAAPPGRIVDRIAGRDPHACWQAAGPDLDYQRLAAGPQSTRSGGGGPESRHGQPGRAGR